MERTTSSVSSSSMITSITNQTIIPERIQPVMDLPSLPHDPCICSIGTPSSVESIVPVPTNSIGASRVTVIGSTLPDISIFGPHTTTEPSSAPPRACTLAERILLDNANFSICSWRISPGNSLRMKLLPGVHSEKFIVSAIFAVLVQEFQNLVVFLFSQISCLKECLDEILGITGRLSRCFSNDRSEER